MLCYRIQETDKKLGVVPVEFSIQRVVRLYFERLEVVVGRAQLDAYLSRAGSACWSRPQPKRPGPLRSQLAAHASASGEGPWPWWLPWPSSRQRRISLKPYLRF